MDFADVEFETSPDGPRKVFIRKKTYCTDEGFGTEAFTYPVTIVPARYGGTYENAPWLAFPVHPDVLNSAAWRDWDGSDIDCMEWHDRSREQGWPVGRGAAPDLAYRDLIVRTAEKAGINLKDWSAEPTWDKEELRRRDGDSPAGGPDRSGTAE
jgi:hypothetical protein